MNAFSWLQIIFICVINIAQENFNPALLDVLVGSCVG